MLRSVPNSKYLRSLFQIPNSRGFKFWILFISLPTPQSSSKLAENNSVHRCILFLCFQSNDYTIVTFLTLFTSKNLSHRHFFSCPLLHLKAQSPFHGSSIASHSVRWWHSYLHSIVSLFRFAITDWILNMDAIKCIHLGLFFRVLCCVFFSGNEME